MSSERIAELEKERDRLLHNVEVWKNESIDSSEKYVRETQYAHTLETALDDTEALLQKIHLCTSGNCNPSICEVGAWLARRIVAKKERAEALEKQL